MGVGGGCLYVPSLALVTASFQRNRGLAVGLSTGGGALGTSTSSCRDHPWRLMNLLGGVVYPIVFRRLIGPLGFAWTTRVIAFLALGIFLPALAIMLPVPPKTTRPRSLFDFSAFSEPGFLFFGISLMFCFMGYWTPFFYLPAFAEARAGASGDSAFYLLSIINACSWVGRAGSGFLADFRVIEPIYVIIFSAVGASIALFSWISIYCYSSSIAFASFFGLFTGVLTTLPMAIVPKLSPIEVVGTRLGMVWMGAAIGIFVRAPTAGALTDISTHQYLKAQIFAGTVMLAGAAFMIVPE